MPTYDSYILIACERKDLGRIRRTVHDLNVDMGDFPFQLGRGAPIYSTNQQYGADYKALRDIYERNMASAKKMAKAKFGYIVSCGNCGRGAFTTSKHGMVGLIKFIERLGWKRRGLHVVCQRCVTPDDDILSVFDRYTQSAIKRSHGGRIVLEETA